MKAQVRDFIRAILRYVYNRAAKDEDFIERARIAQEGGFLAEFLCREPVEVCADPDSWKWGDSSPASSATTDQELETQMPLFLEHLEQCPHHTVQEILSDDRISNAVFSGVSSQIPESPDQRRAGLLDFLRTFVRDNGTSFSELTGGDRWLRASSFAKLSAELDDLDAADELKWRQTCAEPASWTWGDTIPDDLTDEEAEQYGDHLAKCPYHGAREEATFDQLKDLAQKVPPLDVARALGLPITRDVLLIDLRWRMKNLVAAHPDLYRALHDAKTDEERAAIGAELERLDTEDDAAGR